MNYILVKIGFTENFQEGEMKQKSKEKFIEYFDLLTHQNFSSLLRQYSHLGDGTFLVRESVTFVGDYCLSFWRKNKPNHCRLLNSYISLVYNL